MKYLLDAVVILIFLLCVIIGHKRGFIKTVAGIVALIAALAVSSLLSAPLSEYVYDKTIEPTIVETVDTQMTQVKGNVTEKLAYTYESLPNIVKTLLNQTGIAGGEEFALSVPIYGSTPISQNIADMIRPILLPLINALCSLVLFFIAYIVASVILRLFNVVAKLPLLKQLNKSLGLLGGIVSGALWAMLAVTVIQVVAAMGLAGDTFTLQTVSETAVVNWLIGINPLGGTLIDILNSAINE